MSTRATGELYDPRSVDELYERAVRVVGDVTGFDRVMLYRFDARYNGQVIAESSREGVGSFLGLFFPSSDIGARSRDLYLENFTRYIPDIGGRNFSLSGVFPGGGHADTRHPVDMSHTNLRSVAPCHITYLRNIGVQASMSFSINVDGRLWGLFACHHYTPRRVSYEQRVVCEQAAMMFIYRLATMASTAARMAQRQSGLAKLSRSIVIGVELGRRIALLSRDWRGDREEATAQAMIARAVEAVEAEAGLLISVDASESAQLTDAQKLLLDLVEADSAAVVRNGHVCRIGDAPPAISIYAIASMFGRELPDIRIGDLHVFATDSLASVVPAAADIKDRAAGMMAAALSLRSPAFLLWFRREQIVHATWAGNPSADAMSMGTLGQNPRASFEAWKHDIRNLSRPWMLEDVEVAHDLSAVLRDAEATGEPLTRGPQALAGALWQNQVGVATPVAAPAGVAMSAGAAAASAGGSTGSASNFLSRQPPDPTPPPPPRRVIRIGQR
jgi:light-regulated signal transduction histidine kinase (bacteriophytochrome)